MLKKNEAKSGDYSISSSGDYNSINQKNITIINQTPNRTVIYDLCKIISEATIKSGEYSINENANWTKKLEYNNVFRYQEIFDDYCDIYNEFVEILDTQYSYREQMVRKVHHIYTNILIEFPDQNNDGDFILFKVYLKLKSIVDQANYNPDELIFDEEIERTIILIMFYVITKCKLLEIPQ